MEKRLSMQTTMCLKNGVEIPQLGYGTFESSPEEVANGVKWAIELGYRHIDTAKAYGNEGAIGTAISESGINRDQLFIVTKIWMDDYNDVFHAFETAIHNLKTDYLDLLMLHWPGTDKDLRYKAYESLLELQRKGLVRATGVSNFMKDHLIDLQQKFGEYPLYNQIQIHPWGQQRELREFCCEKNIAVAAWGPLMHGYLKEAVEIMPLAEKYGRSPAQIVLRWHLQKGNIIFPKSVHKKRIAENMELFDFELLDDEIMLIDSLEKDWHWGPDAYSFNG